MRFISLRSNVAPVQTRNAFLSLRIVNYTNLLKYMHLRMGCNLNLWRRALALPITLVELQVLMRLLAVGVLIPFDRIKF